MTAVVANGVRDVESEVVTAFFRCHSQQLAILVLCEMFVEVAVQCRAACEVFDVAFAVEFELIENVSVLIFNDIELAIIAVARYFVAVFLVPLSMFHTYVFGWNHLAVEHQARFLVLFVVFLDKAEYLFHKVLIFRVIANFDAFKLGCFDYTVDTYCEVLAVDCDVSGVEQREHAFVAEVTQVAVVSHLYLVHEVDDFLDEAKERHAVLFFVLDAAVHVDCEHALGACRHAAGAEGVAELVVGNLVTEAAA